MIDRFETFSTTISRLNRNIQRIKARETETIGLKTGHVMCLYALGRERGGLTAGELQKICGEDKGAISRTVNDLTARGYVCTEDAREKRAYRTKICLTQKGQETVAYLNGRVAQALEAGSRGLDEKSRETLYASLTLIAENLERFLSEENQESGENAP